jgi:peptidoglycan/xylan/chitin deacetylase (PgdA/CDA1 family)
MNRTSLARAVRPFTRALERRVPRLRILMYHRVARLPAPDQLNVTPERFERQIAWLAAHRRVVGLPAAVAEIAGAGTLADSVVVTFDDGYLDNLENALPVLQRHGIPATIFVTSAFCGQSRRHPRYPDEAGRLHLDWEEVRRLAALPGVTIGSHTRTHPYLSRLGESDAWDEIDASRREIEDRIGTPVEHFCYPSGDVTAREIRLVKQAGYASAVTVAPGGNAAGCDTYALRRTEVTDRDEPAELALKLDGAFDPFHQILHWRRRRRFARAASAAPTKTP